MGIIRFVTEALLILVMIRMVWTLWRRLSGGAAGPRQRSEGPRRFDTKGKNVSDGDFKDMK